MLDSKKYTCFAAYFFERLQRFDLFLRVLIAFELTKIIFKISYRGFAKLKKFQKSKTNLDRAHPTHPHSIQTFF